MRNILNLENFGIKINQTNEGTYQIEVDHICAPISFIEGEYDNIGEAIEDVVNRILNPNNVYAMEDQSDDVRKAYEIAGIWDEEDVNKESTKAASTFLKLTLEGIVNTNMRGA